MAAGYLNYSDSVASSLTYQSVSSTSAPSSSSTTWVSASLQMTVLETGRYLVLYSGNILAAGGGSTTGQTRLIVNGSEVSGTLRELETTTVMVLGLIGGNNVGEGPSCLIQPVNLVSGQQINMQFRRESGSGSVTLGNRTLTIVRIE